MNRFNAQSLRHASRDSFNAFKRRASMVGASGMALLASGQSFAQTSPGAAIAGEMSGGKAEIGLVILASAVLIGLLLVWRHVRKAAG